MSKKVFPWQVAKRNIILFLILSGCLAISSLVTPVGATFYEVNGMVQWNNKAFNDVDAYLVSDTLDFIKENAVGGKKRLEVAPRNFYDSYLLLAQRATDVQTYVDKQEKKKEMGKTVNAFKKLIAQYTLRKAYVNKDGSIYLNVSPGRIYYLVVLKKGKVFEKISDLSFWIQKLYFEPGDTLNPKEMILNESNVMLWQ